ncbi:uncharacterized protein LOC112030998 [Quercus suber]|uniref:uncharacterized protein LOC112030998 n=1 Tax=Quercus suber TaxID=58331 RepID=UPI000CE259D0|nr:uncharacterized protein LOC112030998 [Quercus suber]POF01642.1 hypothetical protein CFP56_70347 [Quercus suber]
MWQVLLAAAVAGSTSLVAKHLFNPNADPTTTAATTPIPADQPRNLNAQACADSTFDSQPLPSDCDFEKQERDGIFRFSSSGSRSRSSNSRKKPGSRKLVGAAKKAGDRSGRVGKEKGEAVKEIQRKSSARKFAVSLKRRKTNKNVANKSGPSSSNSKESSLFGWGLGVGIMYMMSAGKTEISKLNMAVDETAKVVQELKTELYKRKSSHRLHVSGPASKADAKSRKNNSKHTQLALNKFNTQNVDPNNFKISGDPVIDDGEYASSVLTEEPEPRLLEMDELEAEFESELQKLPWCITEASQQEEMRPILGEDRETEVSDMGFHEVEGQNLHSNQFDGVVPAELDQKLCHLLIEQQENQIVELESELHSAQSKLNSKEAELQALKDCVRRLTNFSLSHVSDDETEAHEEQKHTSEWDYKNQTESESNKSVVGMKRPMDSALCGHYAR